MKEVRFHPYYKTLLVSTAGDSFNVFRPNFDPDDYVEEESKTTESSSAVSKPQVQDVWVDSDSEEEEARAVKTIRQINKRKNSRPKQKRSRHN